MYSSLAQNNCMNSKMLLHLYIYVIPSSRGLYTFLMLLAKIDLIFLFFFFFSSLILWCFCMQLLILL